MLLLQPGENLDFQEYKFYYFSFLLFQSWNITKLATLRNFHTFKTLHKLLEKNFFSNNENKFAFMSFFF